MLREGKNKKHRGCKKSRHSHRSLYPTLGPGFKMQGKRW